LLDRLWASVLSARADGAPDPRVVRALHRTVRKVTMDIPRLAYNTAIASLMSYMNTLREGERIPHRAEVEPLVVLVAPFAPHIAEELWERLGHAESIFETAWPTFDPELAADEAVTLAVQVNGKLRGTVSVPPDAAENDALAAALADSAVARHVAGATPRRVIYVPGRLLNLVV
jgi:leucyl-tRNA synthetase